MGGPIGLDYAAMYPLLDRANGDWNQLFEDIRVMESAALDELHKE